MVTTITAEWKFTFKDRDTGEITREYIKHNQVTNLGLRWLLARSFGIQGNDAGSEIVNIADIKEIKYLVIGGSEESTPQTYPTPIAFSGSQLKIQYKYLCQQPVTVIATNQSGNTARIVISATFDLLDLRSKTIGVDSASNTESTLDKFFATESALYTEGVPTLKRGDASTTDATINAPPTGDFMHSRVVLDSSGTSGIEISSTEILTISITEEIQN